MRRLTSLIIIISFFSISAKARIINIPGDYLTIQRGIDVTINGDTVLVQPGIYREIINYNGHNVKLGSLFLTTWDTSYILSTIIDGDSIDAVVRFETGEDSTSSLTGFTIQGGYNRNYEGGGGIRCGNSSPEISYNIIKNNIAQWGGGIGLENSSAHIAFDLIYGNHGGDGSGIESDHSRPTIVNCTITRNLGGGIYIHPPEAVTIKNTISWGNHWVGIYESGPQDSININYCLTEESHLGEGNFVGNPLFVDAVHFNLNVCSLSPCVNGGDPNILDPDGSRSDIGYFYPNHLSCPNGDKWVVATTGNDSSGNGSPQLPFLTIQHAIDIALHGDTVLIQPGVYNETLNVSFENLTLASNWIYSHDTMDIRNTVIDGRRHGSVIYLEDCDTSAAVIGFTIQNGLSDGGGGICEQSSSAKIERNRIIRNKARYFGGGIKCYNSHSKVINNFVAFDTVTNGGGRGGGINFYDSYPIIRGNLVYRNWADGSGGGIQFDPFNRDGVLSNNVIVQNHTVGTGGGIDYEASLITTSFNVIVGNIADEHGGGIYINSCTPDIEGSIIWGNSTDGGNEQVDTTEFGGLILNYCDFQGSFPGERNINIDPKFRSMTDVDYHLQAHSCANPYDSPCIDAGPSDSSDGELNCSAGLGGLRSDMGAFGGGGNISTDIIHDPVSPLPGNAVLYGNYPNPFNPATTIEYDLPKSSEVTLEIFDILGRKVDTPVNEKQVAGHHTAIWNGKDKTSGIYFYRLRAGDFAETKKMLLLK